MSFNILTPTPSNILFIDESYLKQVTELSDSIDPRLIRTSIQYAQDRYVLPLLGNNIFQQWKFWIQSGVTIQNNASFYFNPNDLYLLQTWVQPMLACSTMIDLVKKLAFQFKNKGVLESNSEFAKPTDIKNLNWLSESYREQSAYYAQLATQFLAANPDVWPNWLNPQINTAGNGADIFYPTQTQFFCGIHLPGAGNGLDNEYKGYGLSILQRMEFLGNE
jgi:hypothetical protein